MKLKLKTCVPHTRAVPPTRSVFFFCGIIYVQ